MCIILKYMKKPPRKKGDHHIEHDDHDNVDYRKSWSWGELFPGRGSGHAGCCTTRHLFRCMKVVMMMMMVMIMKPKHSWAKIGPNWPKSAMRMMQKLHTHARRRARGLSFSAFHRN